MDNDHNIVEVILIGGMPENGFEINELDVPEDILRDIFKYKYIDGEFIKNELEPRDMLQENIETIRTMKIEWLSSVCHNLIEKGIDVDGHHYSLSGNDQLELLRLESIAKLSPLTPIYYHADGEKYRVYSAKEFLNIVTKALTWITYHRIYFNLLKSEILEMTNAYDIIKINYGAPLNNSNSTLLKSILTESVIPEIVYDESNYESMFVKPEISNPMVENILDRIEKIKAMSPAEVISEFEKIQEEKHNASDN